MDLSKVSFPSTFPEEFNTVIEINYNSKGVKYEFNKDTNSMVIDRFLSTPMNYPAHYGFVPNTLGGDGDPVDVLVLCNHDIMIGCTMLVRPVGVLNTEDEKGSDAKIIAVPSSKLSKEFENIKNIEDVPKEICNKISYFFEHYKDFEEGKFVKVLGFAPKAEALEILKSSVTK